LCSLKYASALESTDKKFKKTIRVYNDKRRLTKPAKNRINHFAEGIINENLIINEELLCKLSDLNRDEIERGLNWLQSNKFIKWYSEDLNKSHPDIKFALKFPILDQCKPNELRFLWLDGTIFLTGLWSLLHKTTQLAYLKSMQNEWLLSTDYLHVPFCLTLYKNMDIFKEYLTISRKNGYEHLHVNNNR
jgi:hypothetical protein